MKNTDKYSKIKKLAVAFKKMLWRAKVELKGQKSNYFDEDLLALNKLNLSDC